MIENLHLDPQIRNLVLIPIIFVVLASSVIRSNLSRILGGTTAKPDLDEISKGSLLTRLRNLKTNSGLLTNRSWEARKAIFLKKDSGLLWKVPAQKSAMDQILSQHQDPSAATGMLTNQVSYLALHGTLGYWISHMFSGFLVAKLPFTLTFKIKSMFQRGIEVAALDSSYVSSLSFYFFVMMCSSGLLAVVNRIIGSAKSSSDASAELALMATGGMMTNTQPSMSPPDLKKVYETERENLEIHPHEYLLKDVEARLLRDWRVTLA